MERAERYRLMIEAGRDNEYIARRMGVQPETVQDWRHKLGAVPTERAYHTVADYKSAFEARKDDAQIAAEFGVTKGHVSERRMQLGFRKRNPSYARRLKPEHKPLIIEWVNNTDMSYLEISRRIDVNPRVVDRVVQKARLDGLITRPPKEKERPYTKEELDTARRMLVEDGASYAETLRTLGRSEKSHSLQRKFPGYGWTAGMGGQYAKMKQKLESL